MKKKTLSLLLALILCLSLLPTTALAADVKLAVGERTTVSYNDGKNHVWKVVDSSIAEIKGNGSSCTITAKKPGTTVLWLSYDISIPRPVMESHGFLPTYGTAYDTVTETARWSILVYDPSEITPPDSSTPAELPKPSKIYGSAGDDISNIISGIKPFNCGVVPVQYNNRWGLANAELKLLIPFQFEDVDEVTNDGYLHVTMEGGNYIIDTTGKVIYAHSPSSAKDVITCHDGYYSLVRVHQTSSGDVRMPEYHTYDGKQISVDEANTLYYGWGKRLGDLCIMEKRGKDENGSTLWLFCVRAQLYKNNPEVLLRIPANGRDNEWLDLQEGLFGVRDWDTGLCGAVNTKGDLVIPCQYDYLAPSRGGYLSYQKGNQFGLLQNPITPPSGAVVKPTVPTTPTTPAKPTTPTTPTTPAKPTTPTTPTTPAKPTTPTTPVTPSNPDFTIENGVLVKYNGKGGKVVIPDSVREIGKKAFVECWDMTSVVIPDSVRTIGEYAFFDCDGLTSVSFSRGLREISKDAFGFCQKLRKVDLPESVTTIDRNAFLFCNNLSSVIIRSKTIDIDDRAFADDTRNPVPIPGLTIIAPSDSEAQTYCSKNGIPFKPLGSMLSQVDPIPAKGTAYAAEQIIDVDGTHIKLQAYALKDSSGNSTNYVRLRDIAYMLRNTSVRFEVGWNGAITITTGKSYTLSGGELSAVFTGNQPYTGGPLNVNIDGQTSPLTAITLIDSKGGGHNYFKLRELGQILGFNVGWTSSRGVYVETDKTYSD